MSRVLIRRLTYFSTAAVILLITCLIIQNFFEITSSSFGGDAAQNVRSSLNLAKYGIYSQESISPDITPGYRREPLPNFLLAFYLRIANEFHPSLFNQIGMSFSNEFILFVKQINLVWASALYFGLWTTSRLIFSPLLAANCLSFLQILAVNEFFIVKSIDTMNTELIAGMILVWLGVMLLAASRSRSLRWLMASGFVLGLFVLTKASGAYIALIVLPILALALSGFNKRFWMSFLIVSTGFVLTIAPWVARNQLQFSKFAIAEGGGDILLIRSAFNTMNKHQFTDAFYAYAPRDIRHHFLGPLMNLSDEDYICEGRLSVFNRNLECDQRALKEERFADVRSFYQQGKRAIPRELSIARDQKRAIALTSFREQPLNLLLTSIPMAWRGFWGFRSQSWPNILLNFMAYSALLIAPILAVIERRISWLLVSIVPTSLFLFYSLFSHFLTRYSSPFVPVSLVCLSMLIVDIWERLFLNFLPGKSPIIRFH